MPMVPLHMSSRQPHPTRCEATPPSIHIPMRHQSFANPPSIHPSMPETSSPINQLSCVPNVIQLNKHVPPSAPKKRSRLSSCPPTRGVNQLIEVDHPEEGPPCQPRNTGRGCPHTHGGCLHNPTQGPLQGAEAEQHTSPWSSHGLWCTDSCVSMACAPKQRMDDRPFP